MEPKWGNKNIQLFNVIPFQRLYTPPIGHLLMTNNSTRILKSYFDFGYYICLTPFRFMWISNDGEKQVKAHTLRLQEVLCAIAHALLLFEFFTEARKFRMATLYGSKAHPGSYFDFLSGWTGLIYYIVQVKGFWIHRERWRKIIAFLQENSHLPMVRAKEWYNSRIFVYGVTLYFIILALVRSALARRILGWQMIDAGMDWRVRRYVAYARYNFFMVSTPYNLTNAPTSDEIHPGEYILGTITFLGIFFRDLLGCCGDVLVFLGCLLLNSVTRSFAASLQDPIPSEGKYYETLASYSALKTLTKLLNSAMRDNLLLFEISSIFYFSVNMNDIITSKTVLERIVVASFLAMYVAIQFLAADVGMQMSQVTEWIGKRYVSRDSSQREVLMFMFHEVRGGAVAIKGRIFTLDYGAVFKITTAIFTFFTIFVTSERVD